MDLPNGKDETINITTVYDVKNTDSSIDEEVTPTPPPLEQQKARFPELYKYVTIVLCCIK